MTKPRIAASARRWAMRAQYAVSHPWAAVELARKRGSGRADISVEEIAVFAGPNPVIVEAGAADGRDTELLARRFPDGLIVAVEPIPSAFQLCQERTSKYPNVIHIMAALSNTVGSASIHVATNSTDQSADSSSLLQPTLHLDLHPGVTFERELEVTCFTLDTLVDTYRLPSPTVLRLDLQGLELQVLESAPRTLETTQVIVTEGSRTPLYEGAANFGELHDFLVAHGFTIQLERIGAISGNALFSRSQGE